MECPALAMWPLSLPRKSKSMCIAGTEDRESSVSQPDKKKSVEEFRCGPQKHNGNKGQGVQEEEAKIDGQQTQLFCAQQSLP